MTYSVWPRIHSLYGRFLGVTPEGYYTGEYGNMSRVYSYTSASTATTVRSNGVNYFNLTTAYSTGGSTASFLLDYPRPGVEVTIVNVSNSTQRIALTTTSYIVAGFNTVMGTTVSWASLTTASTAYQTMTFSDKGAVVKMVGLSTALYAITSLTGFTTSTQGFLS